MAQTNEKEELVTLTLVFNPFLFLQNQHEFFKSIDTDAGGSLLSLKLFFTRNPSLTIFLKRIFRENRSWRICVLLVLSAS